MKRHALAILSAALFHVVIVASSIEPPVLPLAVRNPYLSLWYNARSPPWHNWPMFWTGEDVGMAVMARLPSSNTVYSLLGRPQDALVPASKGDGYNYREPTFDGFQYDSHSTTLSYSLGTVAKVELYFSSPITGDSIHRQSLPASYLEIKVSGTQDIDVYVDVDGMWLTHDRSAVIQWDYQKPSSLQTWAVSRQTQLTFSENADRGEWGTMYFTAPVGKGVSHEAAASGPLRRKFASTGMLGNTVDTRFRAVLTDEPVFAYAKRFELSTHGSTEDSILFTIALSQDPIVQFAGADGYLPRRPLWAEFHESDAEMVNFHYNDYDQASASASRFSEKVKSDATSLIDSTYADIVALSARQVMGATYFSGTPEDPILFLKEISSNGNFQTVDVIFPALPFFLYINPDWVAYLLEPLLENQLAGLYPNNYSMHDLGSHFPNATGHPRGRDEKMPLEECGNMLIMALSYANYLNFSFGVSAARNWIQSRYELWVQWTQFLVDHSLLPKHQLSTDDFAGRLANQTNLAIKGIIGIRAMARLAEFVDNAADAKKYANISDSYVPQWINYAVGPGETHTKLAYHRSGSWGSLYNLYGNSLLCFHMEDPPFIPEAVYINQSAFYETKMQHFGLPLDNRHLYTKSDWEMWIAAIASERTRADIVQTIGLWLNETPTNLPMTDLYDAVDGGFPGITFKARPVVGGHFAALALEVVCGGESGNKVKDIHTGLRQTVEKETIPWEEELRKVKYPDEL